MIGDDGNGADDGDGDAHPDGGRKIDGLHILWLHVESLQLATPKARRAATLSTMMTRRSNPRVMRLSFDVLTCVTACALACSVVGTADAQAHIATQVGEAPFFDTLRVDRLGASGYQRDGKSLTPRIDAFLGQSVWFKRTYANANNTPRSMPSFMASRYPSLVKVDQVHSKYPRVDDANVMLFEQLQAAGLKTIGEASHFYFRPERNFTQGFDVFDNEGALDIGLHGLDEALNLAKEAAQNSPNAAQIMGGLSMIQSMAKREAGSDGKPIDKLKLEVDAAGDAKVNGMSLSGM